MIDHHVNYLPFSDACENKAPPLAYLEESSLEEKKKKKFQVVAFVMLEEGQRTLSNHHHANQPLV
jgi:hypothetical protein